MTYLMKLVQILFQKNSHVDISFLFTYLFQDLKNLIDR